MERPQKRNQVKNACVNCQKACKKCDHGRPCERCIRYGLTDTCHDSMRKERKKGLKRGPYKRKESSISNGENLSIDDVARVAADVAGDRDTTSTQSAPHSVTSNSTPLTTTMTPSSKKKSYSIQATTPPPELSSAAAPVTITTSSLVAIVFTPQTQSVPESQRISTCRQTRRIGSTPVSDSDVEMDDAPRLVASSITSGTPPTDDQEPPISPLDILSSFCSAILDSQVDPKFSLLHPCRSVPTNSGPNQNSYMYPKSNESNQSNLPTPVASPSRTIA